MLLNPIKWKKKYTQNEKKYILFESEKIESK